MPQRVLATAALRVQTVAQERDAKTDPVNLEQVTPAIHAVSEALEFFGESLKHALFPIIKNQLNMGFHKLRVPLVRRVLLTQIERLTVLHGLSIFRGHE